MTTIALSLAAALAMLRPLAPPAQSPSPDSFTGIVRDATGAALAGANVVLSSAGGVQEDTTTGPDGGFALAHVPPGPYRLRVTLAGFDPYDQSVDVEVASHRRARQVVLVLAGVQARVSVEGVDAARPPTAIVQVDRRRIETLPSESANSALSSLLTLTTPGVAADSNGSFHPLGEHAEAALQIDNQPITDQQSRIFSNQLSTDAIQSIQVMTGVPPAEFGDKTSLIAAVTTRSGLGAGRPAGSLTAGWGSFHTPIASFSLGLGNGQVGNFVAIDGTASARFLDTPEVQPLHAHGWVDNLFDRVDARLSARTSVQVNVAAARSGFETPNTYDQQAVGQDQRQHQTTVNAAPSVTRIIGAHTVATVNGWVRRDRVGYDGSANPLVDQPAALFQRRALTNAGVQASLAYAQGRQTIKAGVRETQTWLTEQFQTGLTDPTFNTPCFTADGNPSTDTSLRDPTACAALGLAANPNFLAALLPYDLTRGGTLFNFQGSARITQWAGYAQDSLAMNRWTLMAGVRVDDYDGLSHGTGVQPRLGVTYRADRTRTIWRAAFGRVFLTPYNENLVLASSTGSGGLLGSVGGAPLAPARRDQYDVGVHQTFWRGVEIDAEAYWKFTDGAYDFDVILNTPLAFPVQFRKSQIEGQLIQLTLPTWRGFQLDTTLSHSRSRLFGPELGGLRFSAAYSPVARPDHDEPFQQTVHLEYRRPGAAGFWAGLTWRYDSGLVAVSVPTFADALRLTGDEQEEMGLYCGATFATVDQPIRSCASSALGATRIRIPAADTENDDTNPPRIAPHQLFDVGIGLDTVKIARVPLRVRVTIVNVFNAVALYNFLSTFAGTHFVTPRTIQVALTLRF